MNLPSITEEAYKLLHSLLDWGRRHYQIVVNFVAVVAAAAVAWQFWFSSADNQFVMFIGSPGSSTAIIGPKLAKEIARTRNSSGVNYRIALEPAPENLSIQERMAFETNRIPLGIIDDGPLAGADQAAGLRALLPLEWDYLYVLCSQTLLIDVANDKLANAKNRPAGDKKEGPSTTGADAEKSDGGDRAAAKADNSRPLPKNLKDVRTLADVIGYVNSSNNTHKVYLGPSNASSHKMAKFALNKFGSVSDAHIVTGIAEWDAIRVALKTGEIGLAFYGGPLGADFIDEVAGDGKTMLLDLGEITDAIQYGSGFQVYAATLPTNTGAAKQHDRLAGDDDDEDPVAFCRGTPKTIACRRVLACPQSLPTADAYLLASTALATLVEQEYDVNLKAEDPPHNEPGKTVPVRLKMPLHPALRLLQDGRMPFVWRQWSTWPPWVQGVVSALLGLLAIDLLRLLTKTIDSKKSAAYTTIETKLIEYEKEMDKKTHHEIAKELARWDGLLRDLRQEIHLANDISPVQREAFLKRYRTLEFEIESSPRWVTKTPAPRERNEAAAEPKPGAVPGSPPG